MLLNGKLSPEAIELPAGVPHRLRLINITVGRAGMRMELRRDTALVDWRLMAKDGAEIPTAQQTLRPALQGISIGEAYDFEFIPSGAGRLRLEARTGKGVTLLGVIPIRYPRCTKTKRRADDGSSKVDKYWCRRFSSRLPPPFVTAELSARC